MVDWKEEAITEYIFYQNGLTHVKQERSEDPIIKELKKEIEIIERKLNEAYKPYEVEIAGYLQHIEELKQKLLTRWDLEAKTFKCGKGSATLRTTKSLVITDNRALIDRLAELLESEKKAFDCIRTFDLKPIRKYMDVGVIASHIAHYDEKRNVIISTMKNRESGRDEE